MATAVLKWLFGLQIDVVKVKTEKILHEYIPHGSYAGATVDPERQANEHERNLYLWGRRVMYCWKTQTSMKSAENRILKLGYFPLNSHNVSNADDGPGYVYIIV